MCVYCLCPPESDTRDSILFAVVLIDAQKYDNRQIYFKRRNKCRHFKSSVLSRTLMKSLPIPCEGAPGSIWSWWFHLTAQGLSLLTLPFGFGVVLSPALAGLACLSLLPCSCRARLDGVKAGVRWGSSQPHSLTKEALPPLPWLSQSMWERAVCLPYHISLPSSTTLPRV